MLKTDFTVETSLYEENKRTRKEPDNLTETNCLYDINITYSR